MERTQADRRSADILLPISSLPSKYGIGCFSQEAFDFVNWFRDVGQSYWQILPLSPTSFGDSPYQSFSSFAGNPYFISLEALTEEGVLTEEECAAADFGTGTDSVDYEKLYQARYPLLRRAYERSEIFRDPEYRRFLETNGWWLSDFALDYYRRELYFDIEFQQYLQSKFFQQWEKLKDYANRQGIQIIGDIPIYAAMDSADAWAHPELFQLDEYDQPVAVAGSCGATLCTAGIIIGTPDILGGFHACATVLSCMMLPVSITSGALTNITPSPMGRQLRQTATGRRAPVSSCSAVRSKSLGGMR